MGTERQKLTTSSTNQWIGPVYSLGQAVGGLLAALTLDLLGRKKCLWMGCIMMILSTILLIDSGSLAMVLAARVLEGVSIGFLLLGYQVCNVYVDDVRTGDSAGVGMELRTDIRGRDCCKRGSRFCFLFYAHDGECVWPGGELHHLYVLSTPTYERTWGRDGA